MRDDQSPMIPRHALWGPILILENRNELGTELNPTPPKTRTPSMNSGASLFRRGTLQISASSGYPSLNSLRALEISSTSLPVFARFCAYFP